MTTGRSKTWPIRGGACRGSAITNCNLNDIAENFVATTLDADCRRSGIIEPKFAIRHREVLVGQCAGGPTLKN